MRTLKEFFIASFFAGGLISLFLNALWALVENHLTMQLSLLLLKLTMLFFPFVIATMGLRGASHWTPDHFLLLLMNAIFYSILGTIGWLGYFKHKFFYWVLGIIVGALWFGVLIIQ